MSYSEHITNMLEQKRQLQQKYTAMAVKVRDAESKGQLNTESVQKLRSVRAELEIVSQDLFKAMGKEKEQS